MLFLDEINIATYILLFFFNRPALHLHTHIGTMNRHEEKEETGKKKEWWPIFFFKE